MQAPASSMIPRYRQWGMENSHDPRAVVSLDIADNITELTITCKESHDYSPTGSRSFGVIESPVSMDVYIYESGTRMFIAKAGTSAPHVPSYCKKILEPATRIFRSAHGFHLCTLTIRGPTHVKISPLVLSLPSSHIICTDGPCSPGQRAKITLLRTADYQGTLYFSSVAPGTELIGSFNYVKRLECGDNHGCIVRDFECTEFVSENENTEYYNVTYRGRSRNAAPTSQHAPAPPNPVEGLMNIVMAISPDMVNSDVRSAFTNFLQPERSGHRRIGVMQPTHTQRRPTPYARSERRYKRKSIRRPEISEDDLKSPSASVPEDRACKICMDKALNTVIRPCNHATLCTACAQDEQLVKCPICRKDIEAIERLYIA